MLRKEQQVIGEIEFPQPGDAAPKLRPQHELIIGFVVDDMTNADKLWVPCKGLQLLRQVFRAKVDPTYDGANELMPVG